MNEENVNLSIPYENVKSLQLLVVKRIGELIETADVDGEEFRDLIVAADLIQSEVNRATLVIVGNG